MREMNNINNIVSYMKRRSDNLKGVSMVIPVSKPLWDCIADVLDSYSWKTGSPEKSGEYLCLTKYNNFRVLPYSKKHGAFNCHDDHDDDCFKINVIAWCELPKLPEELKGDVV